MPSDTRPVEEHTMYVGEEALVYCFSFEDDPAVTGGATISAPAVTVENSRVTAGAPEVNTVEFVQYDRDGVTEVATVAADKGVKVALTAVSRGSCLVTVKVTCSDGQKPEQRARFKVE